MMATQSVYYVPQTDFGVRKHQLQDNPDLLGVKLKNEREAKNMDFVNIDPLKAF